MWRLHLKNKKPLLPNESFMKESQKIMYPHSEVKVRLLKLYLEKYLNILSLSKFVGNVHVYDLFCGEGIYENGGKGSPIITLEAIKNLFEQAQKTGTSTSKFLCRFNDIDKEKVNKVKSYVEQNGLDIPQIVTIKYSTDDYKQLVKEVAEEVDQFKKRKGFVFIDPYGYKEIRVNDIRNLLENGNTEVLLFLPTQFMFRFEKKATPESLKEFIDELMPHEKWPKSETGISFIEQLTEAFRKELGESYFVDSFIITRDKNQFFCLFFFTSHIYGFDRMLHVKWEIDEEEGRGWQFEEAPSLFSQTEKRPNTEKFERRLTDFLRIRRTNAEVYEFTLHCGHLPSHANQILIKLQNAGNLESLNADNKPGRKNAFYLNYQAYRDEPKKIYLRKKIK